MSPRYLPFALVLAIAGAFVMVPRAGAQERLGLSAEGKIFLESLVKDLLFDPKGAERVSVKMPARTVWASLEQVQVQGWYVAGKDGQPGRIYFTDGASIPAPSAKYMTKIDFVAFCNARYVPGADKKDIAATDDLVRKLKLTAVGAVPDHDLALAAWLHRLGHEELAARALAAAGRSDDDPQEHLRLDLAWSAFAAMVHAYMVRVDEEALAHGERLLRLYANEVKTKEFRQTTRIAEELKRRQKTGTFGKEPAAKWPEDFDKWDAAKKTAYLIDALDEVDVRQLGQPGWPNLAADRRVAELIRVGEPAVAALIDTLEKDDRLTRSVQCFRDFARQRTVLSVREAALTALTFILRTRLFEPTAGSDSFTSRGVGEARDTAKRLREYWKTYGGLPFDERMMKVLTSPKEKFPAKREAAANLAALKPVEIAGAATTDVDLFAEAPKVKQHPAVAKFSNPTVAEAIVTVMENELNLHDASPPKERADQARRAIEGSYITALIELGDKRIIADLTRRAASAKSLRARLQWAEVAHYLGDPKLFVALADEFRTGVIKLSKGDAADGDLRAIIVTFLDAATPEAGAALDALADAKHTLHKAAARHVLAGDINKAEDQVWFAHVFCLRILRQAVNDLSPTGATYTVEKGGIVRKDAKGVASALLPAFLADPLVRRYSAPERVCDVAAAKLAALVVGLPSYHPLLKESYKRLEIIMETLDRFEGKLRGLHFRERDVLSMSRSSPAYIPDVRPLKRGATAEDVKAGKAIFHLAGKGTLTDLVLPAMAVLKAGPKNTVAQRVLIVQAEFGPSGELTYGVITRDDIRAVLASELTGIKSFAAAEREEMDAIQKDKGKKR